MGGRKMEVKEINHFSISKAVDEVSYGAAQNERK
jgi:hypothetical protein